MDDISSELIYAYQTTLYRVTGMVPTFILSIGHYSPELAALYQQSGQLSAAFITAWNPYSCSLPREVNEVRQRQLISEIEGRGVAFYLGEGTSPKGKHCEESILALGIDLETARILMRRFEQNGFVFCASNAVPELILREAG